MKNQQAVLAEVAREFPQLAASFVPGDGVASDRQYCAFARLVGELYQQGRNAQLQAAFNFLETCLEHGGPELRDWVAGCLQALQDCSAWGEGSVEVFLRFLGSATRRVWTTLDAIRSDLADCPTLEAEVLMWRVVHHQTSKTVARA
jgi:hypothetical protein